MPAKKKSELLTSRAVADMAGCSTDNVVRACHAGQLTNVAPPGVQFLFQRAQAEAWVKADRPRGRRIKS